MAESTEQLAVGHTHNWHSPRNDDCPQNTDPALDCTCRRPRGERKPFRVFRVRERVTGPRRGGMRISERLVLRVWPDGTLGVREHGRRTEYLTTVGAVFRNAAFAQAMKDARLRQAAKAETKAAKKPRPKTRKKPK